MGELRREPLTGATVVVAAPRQDRHHRPDGWPPRDGPADVRLFSPEHARTPTGLGVPLVRRAVELRATRTAADAGDDAVGATTDHPHGQRAAFGRVLDLPWATPCQRDDPAAELRAA